MSIKLIPYIRRRVPGDVLLDEFNDSLEYLKDWFERDYRDGEIISFSAFEYRLLSMTMDSIHWRLLETTPDDVEWYDYAFEGLKEFFGGLIRREYNKLIEKKGLLPLNEDLKYWGVSDARKNKYKMGLLGEEEDFQEDEVLKETKIQKVVESYIKKIIKDKKFPESFIEFKTFTLDRASEVPEMAYVPKSQTPKSGRKILYIFPIFEESFGNTPYEEWEIIEKLLWSKNGLHTKLEGAFTGLFDKVEIKPPKTPETYIETIKSLSKYGNRI